MFGRDIFDIFDFFFVFIKVELVPVIQVGGRTLLEITRPTFLVFTTLVVGTKLETAVAHLLQPFISGGLLFIYVAVNVSPPPTLPTRMPGDYILSENR